MAQTVSDLLNRWVTAGLLDTDAARRIYEFERSHQHTARLSWPVRIATALGALLLGAGVLLFVEANWDEMSPAARFTVTLATIALFHGVAAVTAKGFPVLAANLHALGTISVGAGIFLAGQIFNLNEHWPAAFLW